MPSTSTFRSVSRPLPTEHDLDQLSSAIRSAARRRGFPPYVIDRYEAWIFQFLGWCLKVPPYRVHRERIGDFWKALSCRGDSGMVCEAMDAVSFCFGALGGPKELCGWDGAGVSTDGEGEERGSRPSRDNTPTDARTACNRPNPTLRSVRSDVRPDARANDSPSTTDPSAKDLSEALPEGPLPDGMDPRSVIPTRTPDRESAAAARSRTEEAPEAGPAGDSKDGGSKDSDRREDSRVTLFNPTGAAPNSTPNDDTPNDSPRENALRENNSDRGASSDRPKSGDPDSGDNNEPKGEKEASFKESTKLWDARREAKSPTSISHQDFGQASKEQQVSFNVSRSVAERLRDAAHRLGLPPGVFAARAIDLVCEEIGIERPGEEDAESPLEKYQAQLDLLHLGAEEQDEGSSSITGSEGRRSTDEASGETAEAEDSGSQKSGNAKGWRLDKGENARDGPSGASLPRGSVGNDGTAKGEPVLNLSEV